MSQNILKVKLAQGAVACGLWVTLEAATVSEIAAVLGYDWICIDAEHGGLDFHHIQEHLRAVRNSNTVPLVRIPQIEQGFIKRVLDLGAAGILVPMVRSAADVEQAVRFAKYPPWGIRGVGGERATQWGLSLNEYTRKANDETLVIPLIETVEGGAALDAILDAPGVDAIFLGPADYSSSCGHVGEWEAPGVAEQLLAFKDQARAHGKACGVLTTDIANARLRREQGFQMIALGSDTSLLIRASVEALRALKE